MLVPNTNTRARCTGDDESAPKTYYLLTYASPRVHGVARSVLTPPGARRGAAASTPQILYNSQMPSVHRLGRNKPGMPKLILSAQLRGQPFCVQQPPTKSPRTRQAGTTARPWPARCMRKRRRRRPHPTRAPSSHGLSHWHLRRKWSATGSRRPGHASSTRTPSLAPRRSKCGRRRPPFHLHRRKRRQTCRGRLRPEPPSRRRHRRRAQHLQLRPSSAADRVAHAHRTDSAPPPTRRRPCCPPHRNCGQKEALLRLLQPRIRLRRLHHLGPVRQVVRGHFWKFQSWLHNVRRSLRRRCARCWP